jgi:cytosine/uracil/thiamine/allantoin permease
MMGSCLLMFLSLVALIRRFNLTAGLGFSVYLACLLLCILAVNLLNNNYPDSPVTGTQKKNFNRLFLLNFVFLVFLFATFFNDTRALRSMMAILHRDISGLPVTALLVAAGDTLMLLFQLIILYGLYVLRRELYFNFYKRKFEFEKNQPG